MANSTGAGAAFCPFFVKEADKSVTCEGLLPGTLTAMKFETADDRRAYVETVCCAKDCGRLCPLALSLMRLYDEKGNRRKLRVTRLVAEAVRPAGQRKAPVRHV